MASVKTTLKEKYNLSSYQIAQLSFFCKTLGSEFSKILIMGVLFHNQLSYYFFSLLVMLVLRSLMGGLHFYTYWKCLISSILYLVCVIYFLPQIYIPLYIQLITLLASTWLCHHVGPVTSKYRSAVCQKNFKRNTNLACKFIFLYVLLLYIIPENSFLIVGFWVIILHSLQLLVAKIYEKGDR